MPVFFKRTDAVLGQIIGVCTVIAAVFFLGDGDILTAITFTIAGVFLFTKSNPEYSVLLDFVVKIVYFVLIGIGLGFSSLFR